MPISLILSLLILVILSGWTFQRFYRKHMQGEDAPKQDVKVTILDKQSIAIEEAKVGEEEEEYWIYVQKGRFGPKREFQIGIHYFHALNPGDKGTLTYQGNKFLHFALLRE
ncbi:RNA polymerase subunit sigma [Vibrio sp. 10N.286.49.B3]|uniref:DUF2500 domain-containing protein n=1 Tax=Vibrio sp. 10N.286.49.B3 TaxID=1880855 RepID=UPI000C834C49|nr:DUF2500 domain-containing protein [Vibrio sp. 10N.286.49.B3]PMH45441.1 RNA polymerase subunit sigma [Vibrio sp. 10N.286.49.B3]